MDRAQSSHPLAGPLERVEGKGDDHPAILALGGLIHTLLTEKPWVIREAAFNLDEF